MYVGNHSANGLPKCSKVIIGMKRFWSSIYNYFFLPIFYFLLLLGSVFNKKIKEGRKGRKKLFENLIIDLAGLDRTKKIIWIHSSSLGEFEQAKPVIEELKKKFNPNILVTFFSPSGYLNSIRYPFADIVSYLPVDKKEDIRRFINLVKPGAVVLMRYDVWPNMIWELQKRKIPLFLIDATLRSKSKRLLPLIRNFSKSVFSAFTKILTVSESDRTNFLRLGITPAAVEVVGDTRYDRVFSKSLEAKQRQIMNPGISSGKKVLIMGSSWEADEDVILPAVLKLFEKEENLLLIIAPHEPTVLRLEKLEHYFAGKFKTIRFSHLNDYRNERIILVDSIGILLSLYNYADVVFVGGSFKQGIHNILEPAVYGVPIFFGPKIENSYEARLLVKKGGALVTENKKQAYKFLRKVFSDDKLRAEMGKISEEFVRSNIGATGRIIKRLEEYF